MDIQDICKQRRYELRVSNQAIADDAGLSVNTVANFFAARSKAPTMNTVGPICAALGVSLDEFFGVCVENREEAELKQQIEDLNAQLSRQNEMEAVVRDAVHTVLSESAFSRIVLWFRALFGKPRQRGAQMDKAHQQAQETRKANAEKRREELLAYQRDRREIRAGLKAIITSETATPAEKLEAARIILELDKV